MTPVFAAISAFNLVCTGSLSSGKILDLSKPKSEVALVLRVDLAHKRWCSGDCKTTAEIKEIRESSIVFRMAEDENGDDIFFVSRETGDFFDRQRFFLIDRIRLAQGNCQKSAFTGFPARKF